MEGYAKCLECKGIDRHVVQSVEQMREEVKRAMVNSAREVCGSLRGERKTQRMYGGIML